MTPIEQATRRVTQAAEARDRLEAKFSEKRGAGASREEVNATAAELMSARGEQVAAEKAREQLFEQRRTPVLLVSPGLRS